MKHAELQLLISLDLRSTPSLLPHLKTHESSKNKSVNQNELAVAIATIIIMKLLLVAILENRILFTGSREGWLVLIYSSNEKCRY